MWLIKIVCLDDLKTANKKANKAKTSNELSSNNEDIKKKRIRKKRRDNKSQNIRFSDSDTSFDNNNDDENTYPITSILNSRKSINGKYYFQ